MFKSSKQKLHKEDLGLIWALQTRAWGFFSSFTIVRFWQMVRSEGAWFQDEPKCSTENYYDCLGPYNEKLIDPILQYSRNTLTVLMILSAILCIICYKKRDLANSFMVLECLIRTVVIFKPNTVTYTMNPVNLTM